VRTLLEEGQLKKVSPGKYVKLKASKFGKLGPKFEHLVESFLNGGDFLLVDTNQFGGFWLGFTQVSMTPVVLNRKRHGIFSLSGKWTKFERRRNFPKTPSREFLLLYMLETEKYDDYGNSIEEIFHRIKTEYDKNKLLSLARKYGKLSSLRFLEEEFASVSV